MNLDTKNLPPEVAALEKQLVKMQVSERTAGEDAQTEAIQNEVA